MALAPTVDSLDSIPENLRGAYVADGDKFKLDVEFEDVDGLKKALASERGMNKAAKDKVAKWEKLGVSPEDIEQRLADERKKAEDAALKAGKFDEVLATHLGKAKQERDAAVNAADKQRDSALGIARRAIVDTHVGSALAKQKATTSGLSLLPNVLGSRVQLEFGDDGKETISILEADGKTPMVGNGPNGLATFDDLVKDAVKNFPDLFEGSGAGGGGTSSKTNAGGAGGKTITRAEFYALGPMEKAAKAKTHKIVD